MVLRVAAQRGREVFVRRSVGDLAQERFQVVADEAVEDGALRGSGLVGGGAHDRRASQARAVPCRERLTDDRWARRLLDTTPGCDMALLANGSADHLTWRSASRYTPRDADGLGKGVQSPRCPAAVRGDDPGHNHCPSGWEGTGRG